MASQYYSQFREPSGNAATAERLLSRYPNLSEQELASLIHTFTHLPVLDLGIMAEDEELGDKLAAFNRDHGRELSAPVSGLMWAMAVPAAIAIGVLILALAA